MPSAWLCLCILQVYLSLIDETAARLVAVLAITATPISALQVRPSGSRAEIEIVHGFRLASILELRGSLSSIKDMLEGL